MSLIRLNQLHDEIMTKVDEKDIAIKQQIETSLQYTVGPEAPATPSIGYRWFDTTSSLMKVWNGTGSGADWEITNANAIYLPGKNTVESLAATRKEISTGSGFIEFGGRIKSDKTINTSMMANAGIPRQAGIIGTGDSAKKHFWFENFFLLNGNGYSEEGLDASTGEITNVYSNGTSIYLRGTNPNSPVILNNKLMAVNLPEAPNSVNELVRDELVFIEIWKEDIAKTGYVFPYGNVQYTGDDSDGIQTVQFNGEVGYCESFDGDHISITTVNADGSSTVSKVAKGKGWKWNDLKATFKNNIAANYRHNIFVDGDKMVQVRYRLRVVKFAKNPATQLSTTTVLGYSKDNDISATIKAQGMLTSATSTDSNYSILAPFNINNPHSLSGTYSTKYVSDLSHDGYVFAIPLALVSRRNAGVFDTIFNPNGSARFRDGLRLVADYDATDDIIGFALMDKDNATLASSTTGSTWETKYAVMMNWLFDRTTVLPSNNNDKGYVVGGYMDSGISGRYDGFYCDEINETDINDLRIDVNKQLDLNYLLEKEFNKFILGDQRGWNQETHVHYWTGDVGYNASAVAKDSATGNRIYLKNTDGTQIKGFGFVTELPIYYKKSDGSEIKGISAEFATKITSDYSSVIYIRPGIKSSSESTRDYYTNKFAKRVQVRLAPVLDNNGAYQYDADGKVIQKIVINDTAGEIYVDAMTEIIIVTPKDRAFRKTKLHVDLIGDPAGNSFKFSTSQKVADLPADTLLENGNIVFTGQNYFVYRGSIKNKNNIINEFTNSSTGNFKIDEMDTNTWVNVTGKGGYSEGWKMYGNLGNSLLVDESGISQLPRDILSGLSETEIVNGVEVRKFNKIKFFKLSKPVKSVKKVLVTTDKRAGKKAFLTQITAANNGVSIINQVNTTSATFAYDNETMLVDTNTIAINWEAFTDDAIVEVYYSTESNPTMLTSSTRVEAIGDIWVGNSLDHNLGCIAISNMIDKVPTHRANPGTSGPAKRIPLSTYLLNKGADGAIINDTWTSLTHEPVNLLGSGPAVKVIPYLTSISGELYLKLIYKELDPTKKVNGVAYTFDNSTFVVVDGETMDNNAGNPYNVKVGQRRIKLPYYFGDAV